MGVTSAIGSGRAPASIFPYDEDYELNRGRGTTMSPASVALSPRDLAANPMFGKTKLRIED